MSREIKACPFCGGEAWLNDYEAKHGDMTPESRCTTSFSLSAYTKGSEREEHLKCAADWIPQLEGALSSLKRELTNDR